MLAEKNDSEISGKPSSEVERSAVGRLELRDGLLDGLDNVMRWGRSFTHYTQLADGGVRAYFSDGSFADGDLIVGADGPESPVRKQLLPALERVDLGIQAVAGRYILDETTEHQFPHGLANGSLNNIVPSGKGWMFLSAWSSGSLENANAQRYIVWAYITPRTLPAQASNEQNPSLLRDNVLDSISTWSSTLKELVAGSDISTIKAISLKTMPQLTPWMTSNVTVLGDAIHNMPPTGGMGANTALRDAETLARCLIDAVAGRLDLTTAVATYEEQMRGYANEALAFSTQNATRACEDGSAHRFLFKGFLKTAQKFPVVMRNTLGRSVRSS